MGELDVLLTNDDGIDSTGFHALYESLDEIGTVTAVAPAEDQSAVGRAMSQAVAVSEHELGYVIDGTPVDCVVAGLSSIVPEADMVVAGCNRGANLGSAVLGRSGTVSAAVEAAFFEVPAIAVSMYIPVDEYTYGEDFDEVPAHQYTEAVRATSYLSERALGSGVFEEADYLNVNAPVTDRATGEMAVTRPSHVYRMNATRDGDTVELEDRIWNLMEAGEVPDPEGTDRWAIMQNKVSVSPLTAPHTTEHHERLDTLAGDYPNR
ncbi:5'/3'-nucleotidase SurE [Halobacteriales archaeon QH_2_65_14]|nr:MAG: 5'/3'-nucleotidase SurE [Halobacteriales archaeon QH_2_65_14]